MGKFRKMLAGVLSAAMVLSTMTVTAFAEDTNKMPTINIEQPGSITINKYEGNDTSKPLAGVEFTIYKIADLVQGSNPVELKYKSLIGDDVTISGNTEYKDIKTAVDSKIAEGSLTGTSATTVMESGKATAKFTNLTLGVYLVEETKAPSQVVNKTANFLVSVPMTNADGDDWVYNITADPKNDTVYGEITLEKIGKTVKSDGNLENTPLEGVNFVLQKEDPTDGWKTENSYSTNSDGKIEVKELAPAKYRFIETNRGNNSGYIMDGVTVYEFTVNSDGTITYAGEKKGNITITVKNEKPDMTKQVQKRNATNPWGQDADYSVGDMVPYKITIGVPSNITKLKEFTLTDTPTNLEDDLTSVVVKCGETTLTTDSDYTIGKDTTNGKGFKITFTTANMTPYAGKQIVVTYNAKLLSTAVTTTEGNPNTAKLEYSNKILPDTDDDGNPNKPGKDAIKDTATVYTFKLQINKKANSVDGDNLTGVKFDLYKEVPAGTKGAASAEDVKNAGLDTNKTWMKIAADLTTKNGTVEKSDLANGTYYLVETKTVEGYNLLKAPVEVTLNIVYKTTTKKEYVIDENGVKTLVKNEIEKTKTTFTENEATSTGTHTETIINKQGFELPITGGMGTVLFSIAGFALMAGAAFVLLKGRRKDA